MQPGPQTAVLLKETMQKLIGMGLLLVGISATAVAGLSVAAPEIDGATGASALALLGGAILVIRGRKRSQK